MRGAGNEALVITVGSRVHAGAMPGLTLVETLNCCNDDAGWKTLIFLARPYDCSFKK